MSETGCQPQHLDAFVPELFEIKSVARQTANQRLVMVFVQSSDEFINLAFGSANIEGVYDNQNLDPIHACGSGVFLELPDNLTESADRLRGIGDCQVDGKKHDDATIGLTA